MFVEDAPAVGYNHISTLKYFDEFPFVWNVLYAMHTLDHIICNQLRIVDYCI